MNRILALALAALLAASAVSFAAPLPAVSAATSSTLTYAGEEFLCDRLGGVPDGVVLGIGSDKRLGVDMSSFEPGGYLIRTVGGESAVFGKDEAGLDRAVRRYVKMAAAGQVADETYLEGERIKNLCIAGNPISEYTIVVPENHHPNIDFAARELARLIEKGTGVALPTAVGKADGHKIIFSTSDESVLEEDGYRYEVRDGDLVFTGAYERGCSNGVWRFLENEMGWRSLIYGDSYLTPAEHLDIPEGTSAQETPAFYSLNPYNNAWGTLKNECAIPTKAEQTTAVLACACHGLHNNHLCGDSVDPVTQQPCFTGDDQYEITRDLTAAWIQRELDSGRVIGKDFIAVDIAQNDNENWCTCRTCMDMFRKEQSQAGAVVYFANRLSEEMDEMFPGLLYQIFAYTGTKIAPKTLRPNGLIHVTFCYDGNCANHTLEGTECTVKNYFGENNATVRRYFERWSEITENMFVWYYALDQTLLQITTIDNMYDDFRFFRDHGTKGILYQCQFCGFGIQRVQQKLVVELNWNMDMTRDDFEDLLCRTLADEYGDGWEYIREYLKMWEEGQDRVPCWHCYGGFFLYPWDTRFDVEYVEENFDREIGLFDSALALVCDADQEEHVENLSVQMYYTGVYASYIRAEARGDAERTKVLGERYLYLLDILNSNGFDPCGFGLISATAYRAVFPATVEEWVSSLDPVRENLLNGIAGFEFGHTG